MLLPDEERIPFRMTNSTHHCEEIRVRDGYQLCSQITDEQAMVLKSGKFVIFMLGKLYRPGCVV